MYYNPTEHTKVCLSDKAIATRFSQIRSGVPVSNVDIVASRGMVSPDI